MCKASIRDVQGHKDAVKIMQKQSIDEIPNVQHRGGADRSFGDCKFTANAPEIGKEF